MHKKSLMTERPIRLTSILMQKIIIDFQKYIGTPLFLRKWTEQSIELPLTLSSENYYRFLKMTSEHRPILYYVENHCRPFKIHQATTVNLKSRKLLTTL